MHGTSTAPLLDLPPARAVWIVAGPMVAVGLVRALYLTVDAWWVGKLGSAPLEALGGAAFGWWMTEQLGELAATGTHALTAQREGAGRRDQVPAVLAQGLAVGLLVCIALFVVRVPASELYFDALGFAAGAPERVEGLAWLQAVMGGAAGMTLLLTTGAVFRGLGDTRTALWITASSLVLNFGLDPLFIWGAGPVPAMGIAGAAWATAASSMAGGLLALAILARRGLGLGWVRVTVVQLRRIAAVGAPMTISGIGFSAAYVALGQLITDFGSVHMAALGVGHRLEGVAYLTAVGFMVAASTLVGQHVGARDLPGAFRAVQATERMCLLAMVMMGVPMFFGAESVYGLVTDDPEMVAAGAAYLRIQSAVWLFMGLEVVYDGAFIGAGDTVPAMWIGAILTWARLPAAWLLAWPLGLGVTGIWLAIAVSTVAKGLLLRWWFHQGWWTRTASVC